MKMYVTEINIEIKTEVNIYRNIGSYIETI